MPVTAISIGQLDSQTVNPTALGATAFDPGGSTFGFYADFPAVNANGTSNLHYSEDALNTWDASVPRKFRFFPLKNADGSVVPNAYIFAAEDNNLPFGNIQPYVAMVISVTKLDRFFTIVSDLDAAVALCRES